jgi:ubiquinone/menaquinone biosynthesis C-methylase UbiE
MKYDKTLFARTPDYYAKYRPKYPRVIFDKIVETFRPIDSDTLLDLGCGTGEIALPLASRFKKVLAWDPDPEMLKLAKQKAETQGTENVIFEQKSSDDLPNLSAKIKLCAMGQSFHWMDDTNTLIEIKKHLTNGGGIAIVGVKQGLHIYSSIFDEPNDITVKRNQIVSEVGMKYLGAQRKAGQQTYERDNRPFSDMLNEAGYTEIGETVFDITIERTVDETIGFIYSVSWGNKNQLGDKVDVFEAELRKKLHELKPDGIFEEKVTFDLLTAKC